MVVAHTEYPEARVEVHRFPDGLPPRVREQAERVAYRMPDDGPYAVSVDGCFVTIMQLYVGDLEVKYAGFELFDALQDRL